MMKKKLKILAIDDEELNLDIYDDLLSDDYDYISCDSGEKGLAYLNSCSNNPIELPFLILLDVNMPAMNGLEVCQKIKRINTYKNIQILFVSALATEQEQIAGYEAGGDEYIIKPFSAGTLLLKIEIAHKAFLQLSEMENQLSEVTHIAMRASLKESESSNVLSCVHELYHLKNNRDIIENILRACDVYGLNVIISIALDTDDEEMIATKGSIKSIEIELIKRLRRVNKRYHFGSRTLFTSGELSLLVLNMPIDIENEYHHLMEHLTILVQGADSRLQTIASEKKREAQHHELIALVQIVKELMASLEQNQKLHQIEHGSIMTELTQQVEGAFGFMGLTEEQEDSFRELIIKTEIKVGDLFDKGADLQEKLKAIKMMLSI